MGKDVSMFVCLFVCDRQSKVSRRDNCLRWALSRQALDREQAFTLWYSVLMC